MKDNHCHKSSNSRVLRGELNMTLVIYIAEKVAFISLCSAAYEAHDILTGCAYGKVYLVRKKVSNESSEAAHSLLFSCYVMSNSVTPWTAARQASLSFTIFREFAQACVH